jgi:hypothetical protein
MFESKYNWLPILAFPFVWVANRVTRMWKWLKWNFYDSFKRPPGVGDDNQPG